LLIISYVILLTETNWVLASYGKTLTILK